MSQNEGSNPRTFGRHLTILGAVMLTLSVVTPASSMFIIIPGVIAQAGTGVVPSLLIAGVVGLIVALVYAELASEFRSAGGEYVYVEKVFNEISAYPVIFVNLATQTLITSVLAIGAGDYFHRIIPIDPKITAVIVVALATLFGVLHIRTNALITGLFFTIELAALVAMSYFAGRHISQSPLVLWHPWVSSLNSKLTTTPLSVIAMATAAALFAFNGYEEAIYLIEDMKKPKLIGQVILISFAFALVLESIPTALTLLASKDISRFVDPQGAPYLDVMMSVAGQRWVLFISSAVSLAVLNACIANVLLTARFLFSTARSGAWGNKLRGPLTAVSNQDVPVPATLIVGVLGVIMCFLPLNWLFVLTGTGLVFIYAALCVVIIVNRRRSDRRPKGEEKEHFRMPLVPLLPAIGFLGLVGVLIANWVDPVLGRPSIIVSIGEILVGLIYWFFRRKVLKVDPLSSVL